jgi:hypothetical protein
VGLRYYPQIIYSTVKDVSENTLAYQVKAGEEVLITLKPVHQIFASFQPRFQPSPHPFLLLLLRSLQPPGVDIMKLILRQLRCDKIRVSP